MAATNKAFRVSKLDPHHTSSYTVLSATPQSSSAHAASLGITQTEAVRRLSLLCDEGLAVQTRVNLDSATQDSYSQAV